MRRSLFFSHVITALLIVASSAMAQNGSNANGGAHRAAEGRMALVIGNSAYQHTAKLENPGSDAADMTAALEKLGFKITKGIDLDKVGMDRTIREFAQTLAKSKVGVFFYAGHGLQVAGQNYLVPTDARLKDASGLDFELVRLDLVQRTMERETQTNILFLDACRDNPLARNLARSMGTRSTAIGRGLAAVESGVGTLISYSTQPGNVALDGTGRNSPFAGALVKQLLTSSNDIGDMLINVRRDVMEATANKQVPWEHSALMARFHFTTEGIGGQPSQAGLSYERQAELAFWTTVKDSKQPTVVRSYLDTYPNGAFAPVAKAIIAGLEDSAKSPRLAGAALQRPGPYDGSWQVSTSGNQQCPKRTNSFVVQIAGNTISAPSLHVPGHVDEQGAFRFSSRGSVNRAAIVEFAGTLAGQSGKGSYATVGHGCAGTAVLTRGGAEAAPAKLEALPKQGSSQPSQTFDGQWSITRTGNQACPTPLFTFKVVVIDGRVEGFIGDRAIEGTIAATGALRITHKGTHGLPNRYSGSLKGNSGVGTFLTEGGQCRGTIAATRQ